MLHGAAGCALQRRLSLGITSHPPFFHLFICSRSNKIIHWESTTSMRTECHADDGENGSKGVDAGAVCGAAGEPFRSARRAPDGPSVVAMPVHSARPPR